MKQGSSIYLVNLAKLRSLGSYPKPKLLAYFLKYSGKGS